MFVAGAFAAATGSAATAASLQPSAGQSSASQGGTIEDHHRHVSGLLSTVRHASGAAERAKAFERCKAALQLHDLSEASIAKAGDTSRAARSRAALYHQADPATVLASVIARELDTWPKTDGGWIRRFADLEAVFKGHVAEQGRS